MTAAWFADPMRSATSARKAHSAVSELTEIFADTVRAHALSGKEDLMRLMPAPMPTSASAAHSPDWRVKLLCRALPDAFPYCKRICQKPWPRPIA